MTRKTPAGVLTLMVFVVAALASGAFAWCRQHVIVSEPDGSTQACDWYCVVPPNGVISSGCTATTK